MNNNPAIIIIRWYLGNICHYQLVLQHKSGNMDNTYPQLHKVWNRHALRIPQPRVWDATWYIVDLGPASIVDPCKCSLIRIAKNIRKSYIYIYTYKPIIFLDGKKYIYISDDCMITEPFQNPDCMILFRFGLDPACPQHALLQKKSHNKWPNISQMRMGHDDELSRFLILLAF
jgi:hypothetical protein